MTDNENVKLESPSSTSATTYQTVYLIVYHRQLFHAHWSLFIPDSQERHGKLTIGTRIDVQGSVLAGFQHERDSIYDLSKDNRDNSAIPIGRIEVKIEEHSGVTTIRDRFEASLMAVEAPGPTMRSVGVGSSTSNGPPRKMAEMRDCQWWLKLAVERLFDEGLLLPLIDGTGQDPVTLVKDAPVH